MLRASWAIVTALLLTSPGVAVAEPEGGPAHWLEAIVRIHAETGLCADRCFSR